MALSKFCVYAREKFFCQGVQWVSRDCDEDNDKDDDDDGDAAAWQLTIKLTFTSHRSLAHSAYFVLLLLLLSLCGNKILNVPLNPSTGNVISAS